MIRERTIDMQDNDMQRYFDNSAGVKVKHTFYTRYGKRLLDIILCLLVLPVAVLLMGIVAIITCLDVGSPILYKQYRIGKDCKRFRIIKFRNMTNETDENGELLRPELRVTKIGRIIRATSLDELPQIFLILTGRMSIIGPRPLLTSYLERYSDKYIMRHAVKPGLECPSYFRMDHEWTWEERFESDIWYVENCSLRVDIHLAFRLVQMVFDHKRNLSRSAANKASYMEEQYGIASLK